MNANYIHKIFKTAVEQDIPLDRALDNLSNVEPIPEGTTKKELLDFINLHYDPLWRACATGNEKVVRDIVAVCVKSNDHEADILLRAHQTGNAKLIANMEAKYGIGGAANV